MNKDVLIIIVSALLTLGEHCKTLETLDVGWCENMSDEGVVQISDTCHTLSYLGLMRCDHVTIATTENLVTKYPHITYSTMWLDCMRLLERAKKEGHNVPPIIHNQAIGQPAVGGGGDG